MAKKKQRVKAKSAKKAATQAPLTEAPEIAQAPAAAAAAPRRRDFQARLRDEYAYVIKDLRIILIVAALMFLLLFVLNLLI